MTLISFPFTLGLRSHQLQHFLNKRNTSRCLQVHYFTSPYNISWTFRYKQWYHSWDTMLKPSVFKLKERQPQRSSRLLICRPPLAPKTGLSDSWEDNHQVPSVSNWQTVITYRSRVQFLKY